MSHTGHIFRVKANSQEEALRAVDTYLTAFEDSNIWHYIISALDNEGNYTKIYKGETTGFPETLEDIDNFLIKAMKPSEHYHNAFKKVVSDYDNCDSSDLGMGKIWLDYLHKIKLIEEIGFKRDFCYEINGGSFDQNGLTELKIKSKNDSKIYFIVTDIHS